MLNLLRFSTSNKTPKLVRAYISNFCVHLFQIFNKTNMLVFDLNGIKKQLNYSANTDYSTALA